MLYSAELGVQKHDPAFFELATDVLDGAPGDVVFVDDGQSNVDQAAAAGWAAVLGSPDGGWIPEVEHLLGLGRPSPARTCTDPASSR